MLFLQSIIIMMVQLSHFAFADISIVEPESGTSYSPKSGEVTIPIQFSENTDYPEINDISLFKIKLCTGSNTAMNCPYSVTEKLSPAALNKTVSTDDDTTIIYSYNATFSSSVVGSGQFFFQINGLVDSNNYVIHYSPRFILKNMAGAVGTNTYTGTAPPDALYILPTNGGGTSIDSRSFTVPYTLQTGISRFAPMQMQPNSTVTKTAWTTKFPTSAVTYYTSARNTLQQKTTITPGWSYTFTSDYNYATVAACPSDNGGWYAPSKRQTLSVRKMN
ncbi:similar to Saccharomyces cerevisiae YJL174W KRE9 Glycoprotein involved in cell wall beta-glucan assembly [Maudiozyma saulgeensis]|uniref:Similar to Saccharomyces cerevisiae YJL174W KRE9 Glycoprotein involved in cell wall beta-glucan assembly n=1 Tax=Maudiozyma saulgeensis TaxID=1789683 RepID=A0A1X7R1S1_9SACH|nr:similar to Saccharomyces cerevisiae YJL174W KRE9 Glycoprotein involved in cell wall beta-glucan assembly [Kazachstania saulgeensis]